jgi:hypothetical protein
MDPDADADPALALDLALFVIGLEDAKKIL